MVADTTGADTTGADGDIMVTVRYTETYDLSTKQSKLGFVGIHTPTVGSLLQLYQGLFDNYRYFKILGCDITMACASLLPADPLQVGVEAGDIAPQDMFNPILYKACSNDSFDLVANRIYSGGNAVGLPTSIEKIDDPFSSVSPDPDDFTIYYGLLSSEGWRKAMPQSGLSMHGLYPMVYQMVNNYGNAVNMPLNGSTGGALTNNIPTINSSGAIVDSRSGIRTFRGPSMRMPRLPTHQSPTNSVATGSAVYTPVPTTYVAAIVTPPAKLNILYYRMRISWTIEFMDVCTLADANGLLGFTLANGNTTYGSDYAESSKGMENLENSVDSVGTTLEQIMTSGN